MFERFTEKARHVVMLAQDEARAMEHHQIGTGHILLGLLSTDGVAQRVLTDHLQDETRSVRARVARAQTPHTTPQVQVPFTPRAKTALELALREALSLGHNYIGTEHILLALIRMPDGVAETIISDLAATRLRASLRDGVIDALRGGSA